MSNYSTKQLAIRAMQKSRVFPDDPDIRRGIELADQGIDIICDCKDGDHSNCNGEKLSMGYEHYNNAFEQQCNHTRDHD